MKGIYKLSEYEKERVYLARQELKNGQTISHKDVQKEIKMKLERWIKGVTRNFG